MDFQFNQFALLVVCLIELIAFSAYSIRTVRKSGIAYYLRGLLFAGKAAIAAMSKLVFGFIDFLASSTDTSEGKDNPEEGDLTGVYNFRTRILVRNVTDF